MTKNILIPTDFTILSLEQIGLLAEFDPDTSYRVFLVHFIKLSDLRPELRLLSQRTKEQASITDDFTAQTERWKKKYAGQIKSISAGFFYGNTVAVFQSYLRTNNIEGIAYAPAHIWKKPFKNSIEPPRLIARCNIQVIRLQEDEKTGRKEAAAGGRVAARFVTLT